MSYPNGSSVYWMSRCVERAGNVARLIDANLQPALDAPPDQMQPWQPRVNATGGQVDFADGYGVALQESVIQFLTFDQRNPNSILSCLQAAREQARGVREIISSAMWLQLNPPSRGAPSAAPANIFTPTSRATTGLPPTL